MEKLSILVAEDEPSIAEIVCIYLERAGYQVIVAADGQETLDKLGQRTPDLVILDLMLPKVDGFTITRWLREQSDVPIIMFNIPA